MRGKAVIVAGVIAASAALADVAVVAQRRVTSPGRNGTHRDDFGYAVTVEGDRVIVAAPRDYIAEAFPGAPATGAITTVSGDAITDGDKLILDDGLNPPVTFELDDDGLVGVPLDGGPGSDAGGAVPGQTPTLRAVSFRKTQAAFDAGPGLDGGVRGGSNVTEVRDALIAAIASAQLDIDAVADAPDRLQLTNRRAGMLGNRGIQQVGTRPFTVTGMQSGWDGSYADTGSVNVFDYASGGWPLAHYTVPPNASCGNEQSLFGRSLARFGDLLVVGASWGETVACSNNGRGAVFVYDVAGAPTLRSQLISPTSEILFGDGVAYDGATLLVCEKQQTVHFYECEACPASSWRLLQSVPTRPGASIDCPMAVDGDLAVVGFAAATVDAAGRIDIYEKDAGAWVLADALDSPTPGNSDRFPLSLALADDLIVATDPTDRLAYAWTYDGVDWNGPVVLPRCSVAPTPCEALPPATLGAGDACDCVWDGVTDWFSCDPDCAGATDSTACDLFWSANPNDDWPSDAIAIDASSGVIYRGSALEGVCPIQRVGDEFFPGQMLFPPEGQYSGTSFARTPRSIAVSGNRLVVGGETALVDAYYGDFGPYEVAGGAAWIFDLAITPPGVPYDGGPLVDAGALDAGSDAGDLDAGALDAGALDAGALDAGSDAGALDAGAVDAGALDAGTLDGGCFIDLGTSSTSVDAIAVTVQRQVPESFTPAVSVAASLSVSSDDDLFVDESLGLCKLAAEVSGSLTTCLHKPIGGSDCVELSVSSSSDCSSLADCATGRCSDTEYCCHDQLMVNLTGTRQWAWERGFGVLRNGDYFGAAVDVNVAVGLGGSFEFETHDGPRCEEVCANGQTWRRIEVGPRLVANGSGNGIVKLFGRDASLGVSISGCVRASGGAQTCGDGIDLSFTPGVDIDAALSGTLFGILSVSPTAGDLFEFPDGYECQ